MTKISKLVAFIAAFPPALEVDQDAMVRAMAESAGIPARLLRTPEEMEVFRKRSTSAKLGWARRIMREHRAAMAARVLRGRRARR